MTTIRQILESWAHWRHDPFRARLGYGQTVLARMMDGMPGTNCPTCRRTGKYQGNTCPQCSGLGRIKLDPSATRLKINPSFIMSTHEPEENPLFYQIDRIIAQQLPKQQHRVIMSEYIWHIREPTQKHRAERLRLSHTNFMKCLCMAHQNIEQRLKKDRSSAG